MGAPEIDSLRRAACFAHGGVGRRRLQRTRSARDFRGGAPVVLFFFWRGPPRPRELFSFHDKVRVVPFDLMPHALTFGGIRARVFCNLTFRTIPQSGQHHGAGTNLQCVSADGKSPRIVTSGVVIVRIPPAAMEVSLPGAGQGARKKQFFQAFPSHSISSKVGCECSRREKIPPGKSRVLSHLEKT